MATLSERTIKFQTVESRIYAITLRYRCSTFSFYKCLEDRDDNSPCSENDGYKVSYLIYHRSLGSGIFIGNLIWGFWLLTNRTAFGSLLIVTELNSINEIVLVAIDYCS